MTAQIPGLTGEQISALEMMAGGPNGCSEAELKAKGFGIGLLGGLIRAGLATVKRLAAPYRSGPSRDWIKVTQGKIMPTA
jgi:hypothetical protein